MIVDMYGLSNEQIAYHCPSVFATSPHESRSSRYGQIPTGDIIDGLRQVGMVPTAVGQAKARDKSRLAFTKHILRFRQWADRGDYKPDVHEIVLINSSDGTCAYKLKSGVFRTVCENGLIVGDVDHDLSVQHRGNIVDNVVEGTLTLVEETRGVMDEIEEMKQIPLSRDEQLVLSKYAMSLRFKQNDEEVAEGVPQEIPYRPAQFLISRRDEDNDNSLYVTMNKVQENMMKGGIRAYDRKGHRHTTRPVNGIGQSVEINQGLWLLAREMKEELRKLRA